MKNLTMFVAVAAVAGSASAGVIKVTEAPKLDGRLDESCWTAAKWESGLRRFTSAKLGRTPGAATSFAILADDEYLYFGAKAKHPDMKWLAEKGPVERWSRDAIELYLAPDGGTFEYYQFLMTHTVEPWAMFYSESGNIRPDPFAPAWEYRVNDEPDGYTVEARIPLAAFYMTRTDAWKTKWRVNVGRTLATAKGNDFSCWADGSGYADVKRFPVVDGFPVRRRSEDVCVKGAVVTVEAPTADGKLAGSLKLNVHTAEPGEFLVRTSFTEKGRHNLKAGDNELVFKAVYPENGRHQMKIALLRAKPGEKPLVREYPVVVDYQPIRVRLTLPEYRNNFYPGQDASRIEGEVVCALKGALEITAVDAEGHESAGWKTRAPNDGATKRFSFDIPADAKFPITVKASCEGTSRTIVVRKIAPLPEGQHTSWISGGNLIVDGKPVFRRNMYAEYYMGGEAFKAKYDADDLHQTLAIQGIGTFEPGRLVKGAEAREACRDVVPSADIFAAMDKVLEKGLKGNGTYYYISDEPECRGVSQVYLRHLYEYACEKDPYHVILCGSRSGLRYLDCADWFETHPYLNPHFDADGKRVYGREFRELGTYVDAFKPEEHPEKCIGCMPTCFSYSAGTYPTFREYATHVWNFLIHGAKTFYPYAYHDLGDTAILYEGVRFTNESVERLADFFLLGRRTRLEVGEAAEAALWEKDGVRLFAIVNLTGEAIEVKPQVPAGEYSEFRGSRAFSLPVGLRLLPHEALVASSVRLDRGLATYAETAAKVEKAEYERLHRDNQLLGRGFDIGVATSNSSDGRRKLFDGTRDVIGWYQYWGRGRFYEISFPKFIPAFDRISLYGSGMEGFKVKIRSDGEWKTLAPARTEKLDNGLAYVFDRVYTTVKLRLEFADGPKLELYEIELPKADGAAAKTTAAAKALSSTDAERVFWTKLPPPAATSNVWWYVKREPGQDFLVFDFRQPKVVTDGKYINWGIFLTKTGGGNSGHLAGDVTRPQAGYYTLRLPPVEKACTDQLIVRNYNLEFDIGEIACVSRPANYAEFLDRGDRYEITVQLAEPCEDMTCNFTASNGAHPIAYPVNGQSSIDLKPLDADRRRWGAVVEVKTLPEKKRRPGIKVTVLGGAIDRPLFTNSIRL